MPLWENRTKIDVFLFEKTEYYCTKNVSVSVPCSIVSGREVDFHHGVDKAMNDDFSLPVTSGTRIVRA